MRFTTAYYIILLYLSVMFKPLIPLISDAVSHTFAEAYHISTVHAKYGNDHLEKELADRGSQNDNSKNQSTVRTEEASKVHVSTSETVFNFSVEKLPDHYPAFKLTAIKAVVISKSAPPPKFS